MPKSKNPWWGIPFLGAIAVGLSTSGDPPWWWCKLNSCEEDVCHLAGLASSWHIHLENQDIEAMDKAVRDIGQLAGLLEVREPDEKLQEKIRSLPGCMRSYKNNRACDIKSEVYELVKKGQCLK